MPGLGAIRRPTTTLAVLVLAVTAALLLVPWHVDAPIAMLSRVRLLDGAFDGGRPLWWAAEDIANVLLFVPVGALLARWLQPLPAALAGIAGSAACEAAQHVIPHRDGSILDVAMNAIGTAVGVALAIAVRRRSAGEPRVAA